VKIQGDGKEDQGGVYPKPMFDFGERRTVCLDGMKKAYQVGLYGNDQKVIDGTWRELFDDEREGPTEGKRFEDAMGEDGGKKVRDGPRGGDENDGAIGEDENGAKEKGGETKNGMVKRKKGGQGTPDSHLKKAKK